MERKELIETTLERVNNLSSKLMGEDKRTLNTVAELLREMLSEEEKRLAEGPEGSHTRWTIEEEAALSAEYKKGMSIEELAEKHKRSFFGIISRLTKLSLLPDDDINGKKRWTYEEETALSANYKKGKTLEELSALHGRSLSGIVARLSKLGIIEN